MSSGTCRCASIWMPWVLLAALAALTGCATFQKHALPPVPGAHADGRLVWVDVLTEDIAAAASFYSRLFGWRAARSSQNPDYYLFTDAGRPVAGMVAAEDRDAHSVESLWLLTLAVDDVDRAVDVMGANGGVLLDGPMDVVGRGRMAMVNGKFTYRDGI